VACLVAQADFVADAKIWHSSWCIHSDDYTLYKNMLKKKGFSKEWKLRTKSNALLEEDEINSIRS
jgi:hypothetical protein